MNIEKLHAKLITAARKHPPSEQVPYAFEQRIMSRLSTRPTQDFWALWGRPLWHAAMACVAITLLCGVWASLNRPKLDDAANFSQDFEAAVFAPMSEHIEDAW
jgi:hypothetical protein